MVVRSNTLPLRDPLALKPRGPRESTVVPAAQGATRGRPRWALGSVSGWRGSRGHAQWRVWSSLRPSTTRLAGESHGPSEDPGEPVHPRTAHWPHPVLPASPLTPDSPSRDSRPGTLSPFSPLQRLRWVRRRSLCSQARPACAQTFRHRLAP